MNSTFTGQSLNYYALAVSILNSCLPETAFEKLQSEHPDKVVAFISDEDAIDMRKLKAEGYSYYEIAEMYGVTYYAAYHNIRRRNLKGDVGYAHAETG
jgi:hypothetical protein